MRLVNKKGSILYGHFLCLETNEEYRVLASRNTFDGEKFWEDSTSYTIDTIKRLSDGMKRDFKRQSLAKRFKSVRGIVWETKQDAKKVTKSKKKSERISTGYELSFRNEVL